MDNVIFVDLKIIGLQNCLKRKEDLMNDELSQPKLVDYSDTESSDDEDNIRPPPRMRMRKS